MMARLVRRPAPPATRARSRPSSRGVAGSRRPAPSTPAQAIAEHGLCAGRALAAQAAAALPSVQSRGLRSAPRAPRVRLTMEKRAILAAVLMAALLIVYQTFFLGPGEPPPEGPASARPRAGGSARTHGAAATAESRGQAPDDPAPRAARPAQRLARVESPRYVAVVSSEGGKLQEFNLRYRGDKPMVIVGSLGPTGLTVDAGGGREVVPLELARDHGRARSRAAHGGPRADRGGSWASRSRDPPLRRQRLHDRHVHPHREPGQHRPAPSGSASPG